MCCGLEPSTARWVAPHGSRGLMGDGMTPRISRRGMLALGAGSLLGAPAIIRPARAQGRTVYVNSYGGV